MRFINVSSLHLALKREAAKSPHTRTKRHTLTQSGEIISLVPRLAGGLGICCPQKCRVLSGLSYTTGQKKGRSCIRHTRTSTHTHTHSESKGCTFFSGYSRFLYTVHTSSPAFDLRQINEPNFLRMQPRITANMKERREGRKIRRRLTCHPHCSCRRQGRGLIFQRNPFCPACFHRTASSLIPKKRERTECLPQ